MSRSLSLTAAVAFVVAGTTLPADAQMAHRLKGSPTTTGGAPVNNGQVRADNLSGFRGEQFVGHLRGIARIQ